MKKKHVVKIIFLVIAVILVTTLFALLFMNIKSKNQNISKLLWYLSTEVSREGYAVMIQRQLRDLDPDISRVKKSIVSNSGDVEFIETIESVAKGNNLDITIDSLMLESDPKVSSSTTITNLKLKAKTDGSWSNTYKFLKQLESLPYKLKINSLTLTSSLQSVSNSSSTQPKVNWESIFEIRVLKYR